MKELKQLFLKFLKNTKKISWEFLLTNHISHLLSLSNHISRTFILFLITTQLQRLWLTVGKKNILLSWRYF